MALLDDISRLLLRELSAFERELLLFPDDETVWKTVPGVTNSAGNLALHIAGNLQHFVGGVLGHNGYTRDRDGEFNARDLTRVELVEELQRAARAVREVVPQLDDDCYDEVFPVTVVPERPMPTGRFLLQLCVHAGFHLGQIGYLRRALTGDPRSSNPVSVKELVD
jgi:hypothetical protein